MTLGPLMIDIAGTQLTAADEALLAKPQVGGLIIFSRNVADRDQLQALTADIQAVRAAADSLPPLLLAVDQEGGRVQRLQQGFTALPPLGWLGQLYEESPARARSMARLAARVMASEVLDCGIDFSFAPVLDIDRGRSEIIGDRALHRSPEVVAELGLAYMQGLRQAGMAAVAKHFPGHGGVGGDSHHMLPQDDRDGAALQDDIRPYTTLIEDGLQGVMMAHIFYPQMDNDIASLSAYWMNSVLRQSLGFKGAIFSDDLSMEGAKIGGGPVERARKALESGSDMVLVCNDREAALAVCDALDGYTAPVSHARLAAMRANRERAAEVSVGSPQWQEARDELLAAVNAPPPPLELDGNA